MLDAQKPFRVVSMIDPALRNVPKAVMERYATKRDISMVEPFFSKSSLPTIYHTRRIPRSIWTRVVMAQTTDELKAEVCFQFGIIRVEGANTEDNARITFDPTGSIDTADGKLTHIKDEEMSRFYPDEVSEIGGVIYTKSFFRPTIDVIYVPPLMCREQWGRRVVFSVDASPTTQAKNSEKRSDLDSQRKNGIDQDNGNEERK